MRAVGPELLVEHLAHETRSSERSSGCSAMSLVVTLLMLRERIRGARHQHQAIAKNRMNAQAGRFHGQRDDADVDGAVFDLLDHFVAEIPVDADLHGGIALVVFRENIGQDVEAGCLVGADASVPRGVLDWSATARNDSLRRVSSSLGVFEKRFAGGREPHGLSDAVETAFAHTPARAGGSAR